MKLDSAAPSCEPRPQGSLLESSYELGAAFDEMFGPKLAIGRDFTDVPPNKGTYRGQGQETISVRVATRELDRLPSLSWQ